MPRNGGGVHRPTAVTSAAGKFRTAPQAFSLVFLETDKAYVLGNNGASEVARVTTDSGGVQFVERTRKRRAAAHGDRVGMET